MDLTPASETTAPTTTTTTAFSFASSSASSPQEQQQQPPPEESILPGTASATLGSVSATMDFFFHSALDQLQGATELDIQLNPLLMNRVTQLCLAKISIASSGRESLRRVAQLSCFWRRLQSDMFFMPLQSAPQTTASLDPSNMFASPASEPFATWNWLQDTTGLELDYFNLGNEANVTPTGTTGYTTLLSDPNSDLSSPSSASFSSTEPASSSPLSSGQPLSSPSSEFPITSASIYTYNSTNNSLDLSSTSATTAAIMAYTDLPSCNGPSSSSVQTCQPIVSSAALAVSDALAFQLASFQPPSVTPISGVIGNSTSVLSSSPFSISAATEASPSGRVESWLQRPKERQESSSQSISSQSSPPRQSHEEKFLMSNDVSPQGEMASSPEKTEMDVDKSPFVNISNSHNHQQHHIDIDDSLSGYHATAAIAASSEQVSDDHDDSQDVSDMDVDRAIQEMALHSAPSSPSRGHHYDTRQQRSARTVASPSPEDVESGFPSDASSSSLPTSFSARLVSVLQDEDLEMEEEELELHRIKRRRCSEDSSSSDSGPESAPTSPRTPPSNLEGGQGGVASLHSEACLPHAAVPGLSARRLYNLHPEGDEHETGNNNGGSTNPFLNSPMTDYMLQDSGMLSKDQHHRLLASATGSNSISTATGAGAATTTTAMATTGHEGTSMNDVAGGTGSVAVVVVEDLLNLNRQGEGEGQVGILATTVHTRYPTRSTTQRRVI
ncbi:hypothetical protein BG015_008649 [Linnemannia schmuckeri]|uniref:Uncharacterized protein n=1 Tax=Linnemannia schmuckeri TaxID=64567 RepID=A0A9P5S059_9FUNG|nr:hypothetical protein BG015_008649 [Linnemannia schmuckeri]